MKNLILFVFLSLCLIQLAAAQDTAVAVGGTLTVILTALLAVSEALALIPKLKSNSVFTLVYNVLKALKKK